MYQNKNKVKQKKHWQLSRLRVLHLIYLAPARSLKLLLYRLKKEKEKDQGMTAVGVSLTSLNKYKGNVHICNGWCKKALVES